MLDRAKALRGYRLHAVDGEIGSVEEFYFDDQHWAIRYLVANTGTWLASRRVLISPYALSGVNRETQVIGTTLTKQQIVESPPLSSDKPVSEQFEAAYYSYFGWPAYWGGPDMWGESSYPFAGPGRLATVAPHPTGERHGDAHLRSTHAVSGYNIEATDGAIGHVDDFVIDEESWAIRYLVVETSNWWSGKRVLLSPRWIDRVSWPDSKVFVSLSRDSIRSSPEYTDTSLLTRDYETNLHHHYTRPGYWVDDPAATVDSL